MAGGGIKSLDCIPHCKPVAIWFSVAQAIKIFSEVIFCTLKFTGLAESQMNQQKALARLELPRQLKTETRAWL